MKTKRQKKYLKRKNITNNNVPARFKRKMSFTKKDMEEFKKRKGFENVEFDKYDGLYFLPEQKFKAEPGVTIREYKNRKEDRKKKVKKFSEKEI